MIRVYVREDKLAGKKILRDPESYFIANVSARFFDKNDEQVMKEIDNAILIDRQLGAVKTPFGVTSVDNLSTGCKTVLNYLYLKKNNKKYDVIDITFCGSNAIESLFKQMDRLQDSTTIVLLLHEDELYKCESRQYLINDKHKVDNLVDIVGMYYD